MRGSTRRRDIGGTARTLLRGACGGLAGLSHSSGSRESSMLRFIGFAVLILIVIGLLVVFGVIDLIF